MLQYTVHRTPEEMGVAATDKVMQLLQNAIQSRGIANIVYSTGTSQFPFLDSFIPRAKAELELDKTWATHLDEHIRLLGGIQHKARFRKCMEDRVVDPLGLKR